MGVGVGVGVAVGVGVGVGSTLLIYTDSEKAKIKAFISSLASVTTENVAPPSRGA